jgi:hypothetical protein
MVAYAPKPNSKPSQASIHATVGHKQKPQGASPEHPSALGNYTSRRQVSSMKNNDPVHVKGQLFFKSESIVILIYTTDCSDCTDSYRLRRKHDSTDSSDTIYRVYPICGIVLVMQSQESVESGAPRGVR